MSHIVKHMKEINYLGMSQKERSKIWRLDDFVAQQMCTCFDDGDYYALYRDAAVPVDDSNDDRTYAVYLHNSGKLVCLLSDAGSALEGYEDVEYGEQRSILYKQIAMLAGWPETLPPQRMTWRDLLNELRKQPDNVLDMPAYVNVTQSTWDGLHEITSLTTWDGEGEVDLEENQLLINFVEDGWLN